MKDIFLCHTGADKPWVEQLASRLEAETIKGRPVEAFFDKWDIDHGENILSRIEEALKSARFIGVVMSPAFTRADWPRLEWQSRVWQDPTGKAASILPILLHTHDPETGEAIDIPLPLRMLKWFDFTDPKRFDSEFQELLRRLRGEPPRRGGGGTNVLSGRGGGPLAFIPPDAPDRVEESLFSNLLQVHQHPARVWSDLTPARTSWDVRKVITGKFRPPFLLDSARLYSFYPPEDPQNPVRALLTGQDQREERPVDWLSDPVKSRWLMWLYNDAFREHAYRQRIFTPKRAGEKQSSRDRQQYYCPTFDGTPREFRWANATRPRTLAKVATRPDGTKFGVHQAARMRFITLGSDAYLLVEPGWFFTEDGVAPIEGRLMGPLSTRWGGRERNAGVLRNLLMWGLLLADGRPTIDIDLGAERLVLDSIPAHARIVAGVEGDQIRLDRVLRGEGAGESARTDDVGPYRAPKDAGGTTDGEDLDHLIALEASGALEIVLKAESSVRDRADRRDGTSSETERDGEPDDADADDLRESGTGPAIPTVAGRVGATDARGPYLSPASSSGDTRGRGARERETSRGKNTPDEQPSPAATDNLELPF